MLVTGVIPAFNAERFVGEAIDSVLAQTHSPVECIVVDDGSTDHTAEIVERYGDRVSLLRQSNAGVSVARNNGAAAGSGDFVAFLDADDRWHPTKIERQLAMLQHAPAHSTAVCAARGITEDGLPFGDLAWHCPDGLLHALVVFDGAAVTISCSSTALIPRPLFESVGGFDAALSISADRDLLIRLARRGQVLIAPDPLSDYRVHADSMSSNVPLMEHDLRRMFDKVFHGRHPLPWPARERRWAYALLHRMLSGSYFASGKFFTALYHASTSALYDPRALAYTRPRDLTWRAGASRIGATRAKPRVTPQPVTTGSPARRGSRTPRELRETAPDGVSSPRQLYRVLLRNGYFRAIDLAHINRWLLRHHASSRRALVLNLHSVSPIGRLVGDPPLHPSVFDQLIAFLVKHAELTSLTHLAQVDRNATKRPYVVLSFDDGYYDFVEYAMPVLSRYRVTANVNVVGESLATGRGTWKDRLYDLLGAAPGNLLRELRLPNLDIRTLSTPSLTDGARRQIAAALNRDLKRRSDADRAPIIAEIEHQLAEVEVRHPTRFLSCPDLVAISNVHEIGMHSYSHASMAYESDIFFLEDLDRCQDCMQACLDRAPGIYAFPNDSWRQRHIDLLRTKGLSHILLVGEQPTRIGSDVCTRITISGESSGEVCGRASGAVAWAHRDRRLSELAAPLAT